MCGTDVTEVTTVELICSIFGDEVALAIWKALAGNSRNSPESHEDELFMMSPHEKKGHLTMQARVQFVTQDAAALSVQVLRILFPHQA